MPAVRGDARGEIGGAPIEALHLPAATALAGARQALERLQNARMLARIIGGVLAVRYADRCARHADGCDAGALLGAVREVGGDGNRRGWHDLVAVLGGPSLPSCPPPER